MKRINVRYAKNLCAAAIVAIAFSSCATILGGRIDSCQSTPPSKSGNPRQVRAGYLIADVIFGLVPLGVDFLTTAIYKPCSPR
jgi:hypothetical protein